MLRGRERTGQDQNRCNFRLSGSFMAKTKGGKEYNVLLVGGVEISICAIE